MFRRSVKLLVAVLVMASLGYVIYRFSLSYFLNPLFALFLTLAYGINCLVALLAYRFWSNHRKLAAELVSKTTASRVSEPEFGFFNEIEARRTPSNTHIAFEPPEAIQPDPAAITLADVSNTMRPVAPVLDMVINNDPVAVLSDDDVLVENALRKAKGMEPITPRDKQAQQLDRLKFICRLLKELNLEVAVWTESEIATLANTLLDDTSKDKDMVAILMPQAVVRLNMDRTFEFEYHAQVLNKIVLATGQDLGVNFVNSSKDRSSGHCIVNFEYHGRPVTWRFIEGGDRLSEKFIKNALNWVGKRAYGRFFLLETSPQANSFVFVPNEVLRQISINRLVAA